MISGIEFSQFLRMILPTLVTFSCEDEDSYIELDRELLLDIVISLNLCIRKQRLR